MSAPASANGAADGQPATAGPAEVAHAGLRGTIAAMAMTGMRAFTVHAGIVEETPPRAIFRQKARGLIRRVLSEMRSRPRE